MNKSTDFIRIDINSGNVRKSISCCQSDSFSRTLCFALVDAGEPILLDDCAWAEIIINKTDGYLTDNTCVISGNEVQYTLRSTDISALGTNLAQIMLTFKDGTVLTTPTFEIVVFSKQYDPKVQKSMNEYTSITQQLVKVTELADETQTNAINAANSAAEASSIKDSILDIKEAADQVLTIAPQVVEMANSAATSEENAKVSEDNAAASAISASESAATATSAASSIQAYVSQAESAASSASESATSAATSEDNASEYEEGAKGYYEQAKRISEGLSGALKPIGTVTFSNLPTVTTASVGDMYNVSDEFTSTSDFIDGSGKLYPAGSNVYLTNSKKWDVLAGSPVTGIKGSAESTYRQGNVNIQASDLGLASVATSGNYSDLNGKLTADGTTIVNTNNVLSAVIPTATTSVAGIVKPDGTTLTVVNGVLSIALDNAESESF